jgi:hypothetical protein
VAAELRVKHRRTPLVGVLEIVRARDVFEPRFRLLGVSESGGRELLDELRRVR